MVLSDEVVVVRLFVRTHPILSFGVVSRASRGGIITRDDAPAYHVLGTPFPRFGCVKVVPRPTGPLLRARSLQSVLY